MVWAGDGDIHPLLGDLHLPLAGPRVQPPPPPQLGTRGAHAGGALAHQPAPAQLHHADGQLTC